LLKRILIVSALFALLVPAASSAAAMTHSEGSLLREMNRVRAQHGLGALRYDAHLERAARAHSHEMLAQNVFAHGAFGSRMLQFDVTGTLAGENLAWGTGNLGSVRSIARAWLHSPAHRANILGGEYREFGVSLRVGPFSGAPGAHVWVNHFGNHC
jgi:uncharacterized protein YkwD